ncbi:MAG: type II secretion system F family protein [Acidimicrobiales bacterium]
MNPDDRPHRPVARHLDRPAVSRRLGILAAVLLTVLTLLAGFAPGAGAQEDPGAGYTVTGIDASDPARVAVTVTGLTQPPGQVEVVENGEPVDGVEVSSTVTAGLPADVVFVVDTNARTDNGGAVLDRIKAQLQASVAELPASTSIGVVSAGSSVTVAVRPTTDRARVAAGIDSLALRNGSAVIDGVARAGTLLEAGDAPVRSVIVVSTGPDTSSSLPVDAAQVELVKLGAQLVTVQVGAGEPRLATAVTETGGVDLAVDQSDQLPAAVASAVRLATDRVLLLFPGSTPAGDRGDLTVSLDGVTSELSYASGSTLTNLGQLAPRPEPNPPGIALFRSSVGLYLALFLAFVGISLGVWSLASTLTTRTSSLEGVLARYIERDEFDTDEVDELVVQSALLQRAVNISESFAERQGFLAKVEGLLERADLPIRAGEAMFLLLATVILTAGLGIALTGSILAGLLFAAAAGSVLFFFVRFKARRRFKTFESQLPDTLQLLAGTLRAGYSLPQGLEVVSREISDPMGAELRRAMTEARLGRDLEECLSGVSERMSSADFAWAVMAISIQREVGGNLNELLLSVADTMVARERLKREVAALTAEGRMSAGILSFLPPGLGLIMYVMNPAYIGVLFSETMGNVMLGLGVVSALVGLAWMKKVITIDV